jgi:hypothetical protein
VEVGTGQHARIVARTAGLAGLLSRDGPWAEAHALAGLGRCAPAAGHDAEAQDWLRQALEIFRWPAISNRTVRGEPVGPVLARTRA